MRRDRPEVLAFVMAGGQGSRLHPLTADRCKPAVPFNAKHRIVDFVLSNLVNSGISSIYLLVQYQSLSLIDHVRNVWTMGSFMPGHFVTIVPPQMREGHQSFAGTADAVAQNLHLLEAHSPDLVAVFGADHVYRMDIGQMVDSHLARGADVSIATLPVPLAQSASFGMVETDDDLRVRAFREKPESARPMPGRGDHALASMGNYLFSTEVLVAELRRAAQDGEQDFGRHLLPRLIDTRRVMAYDYTSNHVPGLANFEDASYWRDVGTIDAYFDAHFDTLGPTPKFRMANPKWPIHAIPDSSDAAHIESGAIRRSIVGPACVIDGGSLDHALLRNGVRVEEGALLDHCIVMEQSVVGKGARLVRAIVDRDNHIPPFEVIGGDAQRDAQRFTVSESGVVVVPRGFFPRPA